MLKYRTQFVGQNIWHNSYRIIFLNCNNQIVPFFYIMFKLELGIKYQKYIVGVRFKGDRNSVGISSSTKYKLCYQGALLP